MPDSPLPTYASAIYGFTIFLNLCTAWLVAITFGKNKGMLYDQGPPWMIAVSVVAMLMCWNKVLLPQDITFWGSFIAALLGLWGAWVDYKHLIDHIAGRRKPKARERS